MTVYAAELTGGGTTNLTVGVKAILYTIKILEIDITVGTSTSAIIVTEYAAATLSAGSAITPFPLRGGAPASSATSRSGAPTGTATVLSNVGSNAIGSQQKYAPPASLLIPPGSAIGVTISTASLVIVYFDEQRLQGGF